jgi:hypothetical protein
LDSEGYKEELMADAKAKALQLNIEGLLRLLGGTTDDRLRFWEIFKGITTPRELVLINGQLETLAAAVKQVELGAKSLKKTAQQIAK